MLSTALRLSRSLTVREIAPRPSHSLACGAKAVQETVSCCAKQAARDARTCCNASNGSRTHAAPHVAASDRSYQTGPSVADVSQRQHRLFTLERRDGICVEFEETRRACYDEGSVQRLGTYGIVVEMQTLQEVARRKALHIFRARQTVE
jgi:hypothetical protein